MAEWLVERGIGETRAALVEKAAILEARVELDDTVPAGTVIKARLTSIGVAGRNAIARSDDGTEYLLPHAPRGVSEGTLLSVEVTREKLPGGEAWKRPLGRASDRPPTTPLPISERLGGAVRELVFPGARDGLGDAGWEDVAEQAASGLVPFAGGMLRVSLTPAMTLIDVDGSLSPGELAIAGAAAAARTIRRLGIGGSIGVDLPTVSGKAPRQAAAEAIDEHLPQPFERTAVNGFGFVQIVRPRTRASLLEIWSDRAAAHGRALLRRAALSGSGPRRLVAHPAVIAILEGRPGWVEALGRQLGGTVSLRADPALPISAGHAEPV